MPDWRRFGGEPRQAVLVSLLLHAGLLAALLFGAAAVPQAPLAAGPLTVALIAAPAPESNSTPATAQKSAAKAVSEPVSEPASVPASARVPAKAAGLVVPRPSDNVATAPTLSRSLFNAAPSKTIATEPAPENPATLPVAAVPVRTLPVTAQPEPGLFASGSSASSTPSEQTAAITLGTELAVNCHERPAPRYPPTARRLRETGLVLVKVWLNAQGEVEDAQIVQSSGFARLDQAALTTLQRWRCQAPMQNGRPVPAVALQPFQFALNR